MLQSNALKVCEPCTAAADSAIAKLDELCKREAHESLATL
jgi:hypothetical protein